MTKLRFSERIAGITRSNLNLEVTRFGTIEASDGVLEEITSESPARLALSKVSGHSSGSGLTVDLNADSLRALADTLLQAAKSLDDGLTLPASGTQGPIPDRLRDIADDLEEVLD